MSLEARDSNGKQIATDRLASIIAIGEERQRSVIKSAMERRIIDKLVGPRETLVSTLLFIGSFGKDGLAMNYGDSNYYTITNHALGQLCKILNIPKIYVNHLLDECVGMSLRVRGDLLHDIFNTHLKEGVFIDRRKQPAKFLHRILNGKLQGFLSRSFNRMLGTGQMMRPFLMECAELGAKPIEAFQDDLKTTVKCVMPIIYEPVDGEFVAFGASYTNSDFGSGSLTVNGSVLRIRSGTTTILEDRLKKVHLGALIQESDIELSDETMAKEAQAHSGAVRDMVKYIFKEDNIQQTLDLIRFAHEHKISWESLKTKAKQVLSKEELEKLEKLLNDTTSGVVDLPPVNLNTSGDPEANAWWAAAALGFIADSVTDVDRKVEIQSLAGGLLK